MYNNIYIPVDNSPHSNMGIDIGITLAKKFNSTFTGSHVYAAALHDSRFKQMEGGLPSQYRVEEELFKQRDVHDSLITKGLQVITDSFLDVFEKKCTKAKLPFNRKSLEGKNFQKIVDDVKKNKYDLVIIGILGLGKIKDSIIGSVCERVVRRIKTDILVTKSYRQVKKNDTIIVALDGSQQSFSGLKTAISLAKAFDLKIEAVSAFDPYYHYAAFNNIVGVLSTEAANIFKFEEQEKLHEEIIDSGLAKIYQNHLDVAKKIAETEKFKISTKLLDGKAFEQVLKYVRKVNPWLLIVGRVGIHSENTLDIGSNTENLLRLAPCHMLITNNKFKPKIDESDYENSIAWTKESEKRMLKIPEFARGMAKIAIYKYAEDNGYSIITSEVIDNVMKTLNPMSSIKLKNPT